MTEIETLPPTKNPSPWGVALTCCALVLVLVAGGIFTLRDRMLVDAQIEAATQTAAREKLAAQVSALQSTVDAISSQPKADAEVLTALDAKITDVTAKLDAVSVRVDELAKTPEPATQAAAVAPIAPAPVATPTPAPLDAIGATNVTTLKLAVLSGKPFAAELAAWAKQHPEAAKQTFTLASVAESGLASESDLNRTLRAALDDVTTSKKIDETSLAGKLNTHLAGLVSIKKTGQVNVYDALAKNVLRDNVATLTRAVEALDDVARKPLEPWLSEAHARRDALEALAKLDAGSGQ